MVGAQFVFQENPEAYRAFLAHKTREKDVKYLKKELYALYSKKPEDQEFVIIDIGCGNGDRMIPVLEFLKQFGSYRVYAIDLSQELLDEYKEVAEKKGLHVSFVRGDWMSWVPKEKADVILGIHSLYYMPFKAAITKAVETMKDHGTVCLGFESQQKKRNIVAEFHRAILPKLSRIMPNMFLESPYTLLKELGMKSRVDVVTEQLDLRPCKEMSDEGKKIIEFMALHPLDGLSAEVKEAIQVFFLERPDSGPLEEVYLWLTKA